MQDITLLNRNYQVIRYISIQRAFCLLCRDKAEVIEIEKSDEQPKIYNYDLQDWIELSSMRLVEGGGYQWIKTTRFDIVIPMIVRLLGYDKLPNMSVRLTRDNIYSRDDSRCQYCGKRYPANELSLDHVVPRMQGGSSSWDNLVCCCIRCNRRKGGRTPEQAGMKLMAIPVKPKNPMARGISIFTV